MRRPPAVPALVALAPSAADGALPAKAFELRKGADVGTPRGRGKIRQGYDSGEVVGYEIDGDDGTLFMALEAEITPLAQ